MILKREAIKQPVRRICRTAVKALAAPRLLVCGREAVFTFRCREPALFVNAVVIDSNGDIRCSPPVPKTSTQPVMLNHEKLRR